MKIFSLLFLAFLMVSTDLSYAQFYSNSFEFEGRMRNYHVYLPQNYQPDMPLILSLHGYTWSLTEFAGYTLMHEYADTSGFIVVHPEGSFYNQSSGWNSGLRAIGFGQVDTTSNDVGFISALIDTLHARYNIDMSRIYSCGYSQGGEMTYRLAIELGHRFAAIASVAGKLNDISGNLGLPMRPISVMHIHGTLDGTELWGPGLANLWSVETTLNFWIQNNNCVLTPDTIAIPDTCISDSCTVQKISYTDCADSTRIIFYKILRGGHTWPGADTSVWSGGGFLNRDINASQEIVNFFKNYTNPLVNIAWTKDVEFLHSGYKPSLSDTLFIKAFTANPQNHAVSIKARILGASTAYTDSVILYDDGMHGDENPNDNIWGNLKVLTALPEDKYIVNIYTQDLIEGTSQKYRKLNYFFLRKGPVVLDHYRITSSDTIPNPGDYLTYEFTLRNDGQSATVNNVSSQVVCLDTFASLLITTNTIYGNIASGSSNTGNLKQRIKFANNAGGQTANFAINIYSENYHFWCDTFTIDIISGLVIQDDILPKSYSLKQNYPNPFNPITNIEFSIPKAEFVTLKIYDIIGQEVATLVSEKITPGEYKYTWDASQLASGLYFYKLEVGNPSTGSGSCFMQTRKLILLR